jgi:hypothetical protein
MVAFIFPFSFFSFYLIIQKRDDFGKERSENLAKKVKLLNFQTPESKPNQQNQSMEGYLFMVLCTGFVTCLLACLFVFFKFLIEFDETYC